MSYNRKMIHQIAQSLILGVPVVVYGGILTLLAFSFTAYIGFTNHKHTDHHLPFIWHPMMVIISFSFVLIHMFFAISIFIGY
jgi:hypothetical protein